MTKLIAIILAMVVLLGIFVQTGCAGTPSETTPSETTSAVTPESTPEATAESKTETTPVVTPEVTPEVTLEATDPETAPEVTPDATAESTNEETPADTQEITVETTEPETTPVATPEETPEDVNEVYSITYILDGGVNADENPDTYTYLDEEITLFVPVKSGYAFAGWTGTGLDEATEKVVIKEKSFGDRVYTATWKVVENVYSGSALLNDPVSSEEKAALKDSHNDLEVNPDGTPFSRTPDTYEMGGNGIYFVKTAYTDIAVDGVMDNAYTYGLHFNLDLPENKDAYVNNNTTFDAYMVMGQDGKMHVFVKVTDDDIVINNAQWASKWWHCDVWQMYIDFGNTKSVNTLWSFPGATPGSYTNESVIQPEDWTVVMTDYGFAVEYSFDNEGKPFKYGDHFGFSFFYNDSWDYKSTSSYGRSNTRNSAVLVPASGKYQGPNAATQDSIMITSFPVDYKEEIKLEDVIPEPTGDMFKDIASGISSVAVVYSQNSSAHTEINAEKLQVALVKLGIKATVIRDDRASNLSQYDNVIYINSAKNSDSIAMINGIHYAEYGVKIANGNIISVGWQANANTAATDLIQAVLGYAISGGDASLIGTYTESLEGIPGANVPKVDGAQWITDSGDDAYVVHKLDTTVDDYNSYKALLEEAGYKLHVETTIETVTNATYYNEDTVINVLYSSANGDKDLRVSIEPMYNTALPMLAPETYTPTNESSITMLNPNNLTLIVKLDNGEFIVIDSGNRNTHNYIYDELTKQNGGKDKIVIAAWIFTHFHQDHMGGFIDYTLDETYMSKTQIKSIILNFPEKQVLDTASSGDQVNLGIWPTCIQICKDQGATLYQARTGQKYYFGNAVVEILHTYDDLMPFFVRNDNTNHTNILTAINIAGQKIMVTGDLTNNGFLVAAKRYGNYLKSDILQVAHHGNGDGSSDTTFYELVDAEVVLVPGSGYRAAQTWAVNNAKEVYIRSHGTVTLKLPHIVK